MNLARVRVNEAMNTLAGDILTDTAVFTSTMLNGAWRWFQDRVYSAGGEKPVGEVGVFGLPARVSDDVANQAWISWNGCSDGVNEYPSPTLPPDLYDPLSVWRRPSGSFTFPSRPMRFATDGLPRYLDCDVHDWRKDVLYFYAASYSQDLWIRYYAYLQPLNISIPTNLVEYAGCQDCLAARVGFEYTNARNPGSPGAEKLESWADKAFDQISQRISRRQQHKSITRRPYGSTNHHPGLNWPVQS